MQQTALITGGLGGIGRAIVNVLHARGDRVIVFDYLPATHEHAREIAAHGAYYIQVDIGSTASIKQGFDALDLYLSSLSAHNLDLLVNNAGITRDALALRLTEVDWDAVIDVNLKGAFFCAQNALKRMIKQPVGRIVNISSIVGRTGNPGQVNYAASKAGIVAMTKTLAAEYARRNILVNAIAPGFIQTAMTDALPDAIKQAALEHIPLRRFGTPVDVANIVAFLSSGSADYITGQVIEVTGGM